MEAYLSVIAMVFTLALLYLIFDEGIGLFSFRLIILFDVHFLNHEGEM